MIKISGNECSTKLEWLVSTNANKFTFVLVMGGSQCFSYLWPTTHLLPPPLYFCILTYNSWPLGRSDCNAMANVCKSCYFLLWYWPYFLMPRGIKSTWLHFSLVNQSKITNKSIISKNFRPWIIKLSVLYIIQFFTLISFLLLDRVYDGGFISK